MIFNPCNKCIVRPCCSVECDASISRNSIIKITKNTAFTLLKLTLASVGTISVVLLAIGAVAFLVGLGAK